MTLFCAATRLSSCRQHAAASSTHCLHCEPVQRSLHFLYLTQRLMHSTAIPPCAQPNTEICTLQQTSLKSCMDWQCLAMEGPPSPAIVEVLELYSFDRVMTLPAPIRVPDTKRVGCSPPQASPFVLLSLCRAVDFCSVKETPGVPPHLCKPLHLLCCCHGDGLLHQHVHASMRKV